MKENFHIAYLLVTAILLFLFVWGLIRSVKLINQKRKSIAPKKILIVFAIVILGLFVSLKLGTYVFFEYADDSPNKMAVMIEVKNQLEKKYGRPLKDIKLSCKQEIVTQESPKSGYLIIEYSFEEESGKKRVEYNDYKNNKTLIYKDLE